MRYSLIKVLLMFLCWMSLHLFSVIKYEKYENNLPDVILYGKV